VENKDKRVNMNKTRVMISGEREKPMQKAARDSLVLSAVDLLVVIRYSVVVVRSGCTGIVVIWSVACTKWSSHLLARKASLDRPGELIFNCFTFFFSFFSNRLEQWDLRTYQTILHQIFRVSRRVALDVHSGIRFVIAQNQLWGPITQQLQQ